MLLLEMHCTADFKVWVQILVLSMSGGCFSWSANFTMESPPWSYIYGSSWWPNWWLDWLPMSGISIHTPIGLCRAIFDIYLAYYLHKSGLKTAISTLAICSRCVQLPGCKKVWLIQLSSDWLTDWLTDSFTHSLIHFINWTKIENTLPHLSYFPSYNNECILFG